LRKLALKYYGDASLSGAIFEANRDLLDNEDDIFPGWEIRIPEVDGQPNPPKEA
jgi:nucleoid-associated protein YgaU